MIVVVLKQASRRPARSVPFDGRAELHMPAVDRHAPVQRKRWPARDAAKKCSTWSPYSVHEPGQNARWRAVQFRVRPSRPPSTRLLLLSPVSITIAEADVVLCCNTNAQRIWSGVALQDANTFSLSESSVQCTTRTATDRRCAAAWNSGRPLGMPPVPARRLYKINARSAEQTNLSPRQHFFQGLIR